MPDFKPLYRDSWRDAKEHNELEQWRESQAENIRCRDFLDEQTKQHFDGFHLDSKNIIKSAVDEFGWDRTNWVLASHVQYYDYDGRFSPQNKAWAQGFFIPRPADWEKKRDPYLRDDTTDYLLNSHNALADGLVKRAQTMYDKLNLYDHRHCVEGNIHDQDFTGKVLVLRDTVLKESERTPENQLFFANVGGFGCRPHAVGRAVMGEFLIDGEKARFNREDFVGICDDRCLPDWAKDKVQALTAPDDQGEAQGPVMKGM